MKQFLIILLFINFIYSNIRADINMIPKPVKVEERSGVFAINTNTKIIYPANNAEMQSLAGLLSATVEEQYGIKLKIEPLRKQKKENTVCLSINNQLSPQTDFYTLNITPSTVMLTGKSGAAVFYGIQSIRQLLPLDKNVKASLPAVYIEDYARFEWRGMLFDCCRHLFSVDYIKKMIDQIAYYKLNKFHWHLTEDQGWRIEIKKYPKLTEIGAWRKETRYGRNHVVAGPYGGFYTQEQIKEVVAYAASRYIEVIPEIEMPGHSVAAIAAYNQLACGTVSFETGNPFEVRTAWGVSRDLYCAGNEEVYRFLEDVLTEVTALFPSKYIHIGGDEAPHDAWTKCPKCQQRIKDEGLKNESELQSYLINRMAKFLKTKGKKIIGWEEIIQDGITPDAAVTAWLGTAGGAKAAKMGHKVIMCPYSHLYLDGYQADPAIEPLAIGYSVPMEKLYGFEPEIQELTKTENSNIMGLQGNLWTEFIATIPVLEYMMYPRICAVAEICWSSKESRKWIDFKSRIGHEMLRFQRDRINYRLPTPEVPTSVFLLTGETLELKNSWGLGQIRYTTDGKEPTALSSLYTTPITPSQGSVVRSAIFTSDGKRSSIVNTVVKEKSVRENWIN